MILVTGGSGSGKSAYAESLLDGEQEKYYIATMQICGAEDDKKVRRHRRLRAGKGFVTVEQPRDVAKAAAAFAGGYAQAALLECLSSLTANEMFTPSGVVPPEEVVERVLADLRELSRHVGTLVVVTDEIFSDGIVYDAGTEGYLRALGLINAGAAALAARVTEVVVGLPVTLADGDSQEKACSLHRD